MSEEMKRDLMEDPEDEMLKAVMGDKFQDHSGQEKASGKPEIRKKQDAYPECLGTVGENKEPSELLEGEWKRVPNYAPSFLNRLKECGKWALVFGGLCLLVFYWQQTGQMLPSAAVPSMMACTGGAAWCVGRACK